ncbi:MAG: tetratricopeptide repeat protein [Acidobacteria bacterium]|nr:tetratricopeptide repeat protein [Acidobacteriota bacterium]
MEPNSSPSLEPGSIKEVTARLLLWGRRAPRGLARVEFTSEFARQEVVSNLHKSFEDLEIAFHEVKLPRNQPATEIVDFLFAHLKELAKGVVSISGFETAFPEDTPLVESLRILNINRENLVVPNICQIWWMAPSTADIFIRGLPDINSWFLIKLGLTEIILKPDTSFDTVRHSFGFKDISIFSVDDARYISTGLAHRFELAVLHGQNSVEVFHQLARHAILTLHETKLFNEATQLAQHLTTFLPQLGEIARLSRFAKTEEDHEDYLDLLIKQAENYGVLNQYQQATDLLQKALQLAKENLPLENPIFVPILEKLGTYFYRQDNFSEAKYFFEQALEQRERLEGVEHPTFITKLNELARVQTELGNLAEAEVIFKRALLIGEKIWEGETLSLAFLFNDLANLYRKLGRYLEAEPLFKKALAIRERLLEPEHPATADAMIELARLFVRQNRFAEAEDLFKKAVAIRERRLGQEHLDVAISLHDLANLYQKQERFAEAQVLLEQAKPILENALGADHPATKLCITELTGLYQNKIA